jgi:hypothetical protein
MVVLKVVPIDGTFYYKQVFKLQLSETTFLPASIQNFTSILSTTSDTNISIPIDVQSPPTVVSKQIPIKNGDLRMWFQKATPDEYAAMQKHMTQEWESIMNECAETDLAEKERIKCYRTELMADQKHNQRAQERETDIQSDKRDANGKLPKKKIDIVSLL